MLDVFLHEIIVVPPVYSARNYSSPFNTCRNLMCMEVMKIESVNHCFLHFFMQNEEAICLYYSALVFERCRHMGVDVNDCAIHIIARKVGNIVFAVELFESSNDRVKSTL